MRRSRFRRFSAGLTLLALLVAETSAREVHPRHEEQLSAPEHTEVLADSASTKRPLTLLQHRSLFAGRTAAALPAHTAANPAALRRSVSLIAVRVAWPAPPARMRYRRSTHEADGEPPA